jgi:hypothetical protein
VACQHGRVMRRVTRLPRRLPGHELSRGSNGGGRTRQPRKPRNRPYLPRRGVASSDRPPRPGRAAAAAPRLGEPEGARRADDPGAERAPTAGWGLGADPRTAGDRPLALGKLNAGRPRLVLGEPSAAGWRDRSDVGSVTRDRADRSSCKPLFSGVAVRVSPDGEREARLRSVLGGDDPPRAVGSDGRVAPGLTPPPARLGGELPADEPG